jgi:adenosylhomocysteinase
MSLAEAGRLKIDWAGRYMPVLAALREEFIRDKPFAGLTVALSIHLEAKTACLALLLKDGGAEVSVTGCNPLSTQDDVCAGLASRGVGVFAIHGVGPDEYDAHLDMALACRPHVLLDDGGDLIARLHGPAAALGDRLIGGTEETTTGVHRLRLRAAQDALKYPMVAVNDARCKHLFDNVYGTGQSTMDAIAHTTNLLLAGRRTVVAGYGFCGRGIALRAHGLGAHVAVTEIDPVKALEAAMDGFEVMTMDEAAPWGELFITVTGCKDVITARHFPKMRDGAVLCNAGHFDVEVNVAELRENAVDIQPLRQGAVGYKLPCGKTLVVLAEGRLVNLAAGNGHPVEIMDMSFGVQALALQYMAEHGKALKPGVYDIPKALDDRVAVLKLAAQGLKVDVLTGEQERYLNTF